MNKQLIPALTPRKVNNKLITYNHTTLSESKTILGMIPYLPADYAPEDFINDLVVALIYEDDIIYVKPAGWDKHEDLSLRSLFVWKDTPQGFDFWSILAAEIEYNNVYNIINHPLRQE